MSLGQNPSTNSKTSPLSLSQRAKDRLVCNSPLIAEELSLWDLRKARECTWAQVAEKLGINQKNVSRLEKRPDLLISTLSSYVGSHGGKLSLVAKFLDRPPITLTGIAALGQEDRSSKQCCGHWRNRCREIRVSRRFHTRSESQRPRPGVPTLPEIHVGLIDGGGGGIRFFESGGQDCEPSAGAVQYAG